jgi:hypothetical protein
MADPRVVAVTPLFWYPDRGVFWMFDFDKNDNVVAKTPTYDLIQHLARERGSPEYAPPIENVARAAPPTVAQRSKPALDVQSQPRSDDSDGRIMRIVNTDGEGVRLRAQPSRAAQAITVVPPDAKVEASGPAEAHGDLTWQHVRTQDGKEGWIAADFLQPD